MNKIINTEENYIITNSEVTIDEFYKNGFNRVEEVCGLYKEAKEIVTLVKEKGKMAVLAEGDAQDRPDIKYLEKLPLFNPDGSLK